MTKFKNNCEFYNLSVFAAVKTDNDPKFWDSKGHSKFGKRRWTYFFSFPPLPVHRNVLPPSLPPSQSQAARQFSFKSIPSAPPLVPLDIDPDSTKIEFPMRFNKQKGTSMQWTVGDRGEDHLLFSLSRNIAGGKNVISGILEHGQEDWEVPCASKKSGNCAHCLPVTQGV